MTEKLSTIESSLKPNRKVELEEVAELEKPIKKIIEKILPRIESGEYGLIIGDDASGRIPALILGNFIKQVSELRGMPKPNIIFIPGKLRRRILGRENDRNELKEYVGKFGATYDKTILIVTDTIKTGYSLQTLVNLLNKSGHVCDVATIGLEEPDDRGYINDRRDALSSSEIISGEYERKNSGWGDNTPKIYDSKNLSGVTKKAGQTMSKTIKSGEPDEEESEFIQLQINQARKDAGVITDHLINWYKNFKNEK